MHVERGPATSDRDDLLHEYLRLLRRDGARAQQPSLAPVRTCAWCGHRSRFHLDPDGGWALCTSCGRYA